MDEAEHELYFDLTSWVTYEASIVKIWEKI